MLSKAVLISGCVIGGLILAFGLLGTVLILTSPTTTSAQRSEQIPVGIVLIVIGLVFLVPCLWPLIRPQPTIAVVQLVNIYVQWFGWCQREIGGDAISLHAATMAAFRFAAHGETDRAVQAARQAAAPGQRTKVPGRKLKLLARTGAATAPMLEPNERVLVSLCPVSRANRLGLAYFFTVTDRRVIALVGTELAQNPQMIAFVVPRSSISEASSGSRLGSSMTISLVTGERIRFGVGKMWRAEATLLETLLAPGLVARRI